MASGSDISRSSVPVVRSRSIAIEVIRNIMISGKRPIIGAPMRSNVCGWLLKMYLKSVSRAGATRKTIASVRGSRRSWPSTRAAVARVIVPATMTMSSQSQMPVLSAVTLANAS